MTGTILYTASLLPAHGAAERVSRKHQSAGAQHLLDILEPRFAPTARSKSHSRAAVAAAAGNAEGLSLGIDIEWMAPNRPFAAIARVFLKSVPVEMGPEEFYRGWTFAEAYFKAFGRMPPEAVLEEIFTRPPSDEIRQLGDGKNILHRRVLADFQLCLVWQAVQPCSLRYVSVEPERPQFAD